MPAKPDPTLSNSFWADIDLEDSPYPPPSRLRSNSLGQLFFEQAKELGPKCFAGWRDADDNQWTMASWSESALHTAILIDFFRSELQLAPQDRVVIAAGVRYEGLITDLALVSCGAVSVPLPPLSTWPTIREILRKTASRYLCLEEVVQLETLTSALSAANVPDFSAIGVEGIILLEQDDREELAGNVRCFSISRILSSEPDHPADALLCTAREVANEVERNLPACIQYSKTTVSPLSESQREETAKDSAALEEGAGQTHGNHLEMVDAMLLAGLLGTGENVFLSLPFSCSFVRLCAYTVIALGGNLLFPSTYAAPSCAEGSRDHAIKQLRKDLRQSHPQTVISDADTLGELCKPALVRNTGFQAWALSTYSRLVLEQGSLRIIDTLRLELAKAAVAKLKNSLFGSRIIRLLCGSPPYVRDEEAVFYDSIGVRLLEGWWAPDVTGAISCNTPKWYQRGSLGRVFEGISVEIDEKNGEILVSGSTVSSFLDRPESGLTEREGDWLRTGMAGSIDDSGYVRVTGKVASYRSK